MLLRVDMCCVVAMCVFSGCGLFFVCALCRAGYVVCCVFAACGVDVWDCTLLYCVLPACVLWCVRDMLTLYVCDALLHMLKSFSVLWFVRF